MLTAAAVLIERQIEDVIQTCTCQEGVIPCRACAEAFRLDDMLKEIASTGRLDLTT